MARRGDEIPGRGIELGQVDRSSSKWPWPVIRRIVQLAPARKPSKPKRRGWRGGSMRICSRRPACSSSEAST